MACSVARLSRVFQPNDVLQLLRVALKSKGFFAYDADAGRGYVGEGETCGRWQVAVGRRELTACS